MARVRLCALLLVHALLLGGLGCGRDPRKGPAAAAVAAPPAAGGACQQAAGVCLASGDGGEVPYQHEVIEGTEVLWQLPPLSVRPKGLLLLLHGCMHGATDFFPPSSACPSCLGLPEERAITRGAVAAGYAAVAVSSRDRVHNRCWSVPVGPHKHSIDTRSIALVLSALLEREAALRGLPIFVLGASSGGALALTLPSFVPVAAVCAQIMALSPEWYRRFLTATPAATLMTGGEAGELRRDPPPPGTPAPRHPPVRFVHMPRDEHLGALVKQDVALRSELGLPSDVVEVAPQPVTAAFLAARVPDLADRAAAEGLVDLFRRRGVVDPGTGLLSADPRGSGWQDVVADSGLPGSSGWVLFPDVSPLGEVLNVAWAGHEIVSDGLASTLAWFERQLEAPAAAAAAAG